MLSSKAKCGRSADGHCAEPTPSKNSSTLRRTNCSRESWGINKRGLQYMITTEIYKPKHHVRFVTASSLFDGHDASINIMRRILQSTGAEVIHLGHNRSVEEV